MRMSLTKLTALVALGCVLLSAQDAQAQEPLKFFKNYFVTGDYVVRGVSLWRRGGPNGKATALIPALGGADGVPATADILAAFLYVQTAEKIQGSGIDGAKFTGHNLGPFRASPSAPPGSGTYAKALVNWQNASTPCWGVPAPGRKLITYRVDVLRFLPIKPITVGGQVIEKHDLTKTLEVVVPDAGDFFGDDEEDKNEKAGSNAPRALGASLVVVYRDAGKPFSGIVLYDGAYIKRALATMQQPIKGFYQASTQNPSAKMTHIVGDGGPLRSERVSAGSTVYPLNPFRGTPILSRWDNVTFAVPSTALQSGQLNVKVEPQGLIPDCLSYSAIAFRTTVEDTDEDGLLNIWEESASTIFDPNGEPLPRLKEMGANALQKDLFAEIGYMYTDPVTSGDPAGIYYGGVLKPHHDHLPTAEALQMAAETFRYAPVSNPGGPPGINVHFDVGDNYQPTSIPSAVSCANPETWTFDCAIVPASVARGGEAIDELFTICDPALLATVAPWVCQFSDHLMPDGQRTGGYPGTVGWKSGYRFLRDRLIAQTLPDDLEECNAPGNDGPGDPCERQFDRNRMQMFHYLFSAHSVGIPKDPCLNPNGTANVTCQRNSVDFHVPKTYSAIADFPGGDQLLTLGWFDDAAALPIGMPFMQGSTIVHEWGHNFELKHGGPANPKVGGVIVPQIPREPNCKPNYLSVMNYLFQLRGLPDVDGILRMDFAREPIPALNEFQLPELELGSQLYRTGWYAPWTSSADVKPATKHCDGSELTPADAPMMRVDATGVLSKIDWNADGDVLDSPSQDINFNGAIDANLKASPNDWANIRLNELAARRNVGGLYRDRLNRLAVGPMSLDVGQGDIGQGDIGQGDIGQGDIGQGDIGQGDIGQGDIGQGDIGQGDIGQGDIGQGDIGQGDIGRGLFGGGDLDVGDTDDPAAVFEIDPPTAAAVEGVVEGEEPTPGPPNGLQACLTSESELCITHPDQDPSASTPVNLSWQVPNLVPAKVTAYKVYRFPYEGEVFAAPAAENLPDEEIATVPVTVGLTTYSYSDDEAPVGNQLAYFVRGVYGDGELTNISNFDTVTTPTPSTEPVTVGVANDSRCYPFMCNNSGSNEGQSIQYQQIYAANAFSGLTQINSLTFFRIFAAAAGGTSTILAGNYRVSLSTTTKAVNGLSTNLSSNIGANNTLIFTGNLGTMSTTPSFTINASTPFVYNPAAGNLLLDIVVTNQTVMQNGTGNGYNDADATGTVTTRALAVVGGENVVEAIGLVTEFNRAVE
jgi:hypothetical protein